MSSKDEEQQADITEQETSASNDEPIRDSDDLEEMKRRAVQSQHVEGNFGHMQIFIQSMNLGLSQNQPDPGEKRQTYALHLPEECTKFVERYKNGEYLATAILLSLFEGVRLSDLTDLTERLMKCLPEAPSDPNDALAHVAHNPYISMETILTKVGGKRMVDQDGQHYVSLGEHSRQALQNLWTQFLYLHTAIDEFLLQTYQDYKSRPNFDFFQIVSAFARVISLDFDNASNKIFPRLYDNPDNVGLLGNILYILYKDASSRQQIDGLLSDWFQGSWLWRPACLAYSALPPELRSDQFKPNIRRIIQKRLVHITKQDSAFFAIILFQSQYFRTEFSSLLGKAMQKTALRKERRFSAQVYLYLVRNCYYVVDSQHQELPLVVCDTKAQQSSLTPVLAEIMSFYSLRRQLYAILRAYMRELSGYTTSKNLLDHFTAYFYNMIQSNLEYRQNVLQFLADCNNRLAAQICERLAHACPELTTGFHALSEHRLHE